ncbi:MAG: NAD(P)/FAD-dependent oxidoreductase [Anaerolineae bacterium]|nr:NAD(P)/FAD-dependent oxidoreductase [Anaerolineae bacterium]
MTPNVVIIGAGFGGLYAARRLANKPANVLLIDRHNHHTFTPLLYQVATCGLDPGEIAYPLRGIFRHESNIHFQLGEVVEINAAERFVLVQTDSHMQRHAYDYLIIAAGSVTNYFGIDTLAQFAFGLKTLGEAVILRNHILKLFERATWIEDADHRQALTTFVVAGGGPTGLETAGALHELSNHVLQKEYPELGHIRPQVILVEAGQDLLAPFPKDLREAARRQLESLGVKVLLGKSIVGCNAFEVHLSDGQVIEAHTLVWAAGVRASPLAAFLGVSLKQGGRVPVQPTLEAVGVDRVYVVGDMAFLEDPQGKPYPGLIPVAKQQGMLAAQNILRREAGDTPRAFRYHDRGTMATIGRSRAVAWIYGRIPLSGYAAWLGWLFLHLVTLMGFRNRLSVFVNWVWNYLTFDHAVRIILEPQSSSRIGEADGSAGENGRQKTGQERQLK